MNEHYEDIIVNGKVIGSRLVVPSSSSVTASAEMTKLAFLRRFSMEERIAARELAKTDPIMEDGMMLLNLAQDIRVDDPDTVMLVHYMAQQGVINPDRVEDILKEEPL